MISVRKKLILSYLVMIFVPLFLVIFISTAAMMSFAKHYAENYEFEDINMPENFSLLLKLVADDTRREELTQHCHYLESIGILLKITDTRGPVYISEEYDDKSAAIIPEDLNYSRASQLTYDDSQGSFLYFNLPGDNPMTFWVVSEKTLLRNFYNFNAANDAEAYLRNMFLIIIVVTAVVIILTNGILTFVMSRSILVPLNILRKGTHQIREGNLDYALDYHKKNEFGEVCADFEDMRLRLKQSVAEQEKDQKDRKELITGIAHDLRTPLTLIKGYAAGILDGIADTPEKKESYLQTIHATAGHMQKIVEDLFLFSKLDLNTVPFYFVRVDVNQYLAQCCKEMTYELQEQEMDVLFRGEGRPHYALIDKDQMQRVIMNILSNSARYKKEGRGQVEVSLTDREDWIYISFKDNGQGVSAQDAERIFEIFYRTDKARSEAEKGSGVGLSIAKQIIEIHKGKIWAVSEQGGGMEIVISLPKDKGEI